MQRMRAKMQDKAFGRLAGRWSDVPLFLAAYRHRSLGLAAARVGLDTSTLSRRLRAFEEAVGERLFERSREGLLATFAAERVLPAAEAMEVAFGRLGREASPAEFVAEGVVRVSADPGVAEAFVVPVLEGLRERHPAITIELDASTRALDLTRREADVAVRSVAPVGAELVTTRLAKAPWVAAASADLVKRLGRVATWEEVPWITWDRDYASYAPAVWLASHAPRATVVLRTSHFASQLAAAVAGLGVGLFPAAFVRARGLVPVRHADAPGALAWPRTDVWLVGHRALRDVPRVAVVWQALETSLRRAFR
ncbi:MAG: lysR [Labilithrix sp.]|nr:lysR [Labilithrix sp.]